ncbi:MAG: hypothetical protein PHP26_10410 [Syntrophomonas sp.]|uniref:hypothetical protein n=1 Tax=Syntrophomonas sp. TaxID=2053627 RepID=UPI00261E1FAC|nr:hypothetical protein [Syntrophomonas sp.]MDD2372984.1 hypothetical protein [Syntrophomonadaceae bacterium]MDD3880376.1 hypothetical protein [Syntrophomonas sp.]MDD4626633.1 hypothetical protein [Syntrophomonas sp.]
MFMFLVLTGIVGFAVYLVVFLISLVRKKSKRAGAIGMTVCLVLFIVGLAMTPPAPEGLIDEKAAPSVAESSANDGESSASNSGPDEPVSTTAEEQSAGGSASSEPAEDAHSEASEPVFALGEDVIPGLIAADIKLNLVKWGLKEASPKRTDGSDEVSYSSSAIDSDTGAELAYFFVTDNALHMKYATFSSLNLPAISGESFHGVAASYLGYCATVPFDGAEPEKCKQWVTDNIAKCNEAGKIETLKVGNVEFSLYGTGTNARYLDIKAVKE